MKKLPLFIFIALCLTALATSYGSYHAAEQQVQRDLQQALAKTVGERGVDVMRQDSIRAYRMMARTGSGTMTIAVCDATLRRHLQLPQLREKAYIAYRVGKESGKWNVAFESRADCSMAMVWSLSDQRHSMWLTVVAALWLAFSFMWKRRMQPVCESAVCSNAKRFGGLAYDDVRQSFVGDNGMTVHLTPMQRQLMEMFFASPSHRLTKQEICDALWPKKGDASDTLYTMIRRLKQELGKSSSLHIESDRGRAYILSDSELSDKCQ